MNPTLQKRSVNLHGHATSLALEPEFWAVLDRAAKDAGSSLSGLIAGIDDAREGRPLASACRVFALSRSSAPRSPGSCQAEPD